MEIILFLVVTVFLVVSIGAVIWKMPVGKR